MQLANYLFFTTMCEQALDFYARCGLGKVTTLVRYGDNGMPVPHEAFRGKIMHSRFEGPGVLFYASDNHDAEPMRGSAHILMMDDKESTDRLFHRLAEGGLVPPQIAIGGKLAQILYFGAAPGYPGYNQVNFVEPLGVTPGPAVSVRLTYLSRPSNAVTMAVQ